MGQRCEIRDRSVTGRVTQDDNSQTGTNCFYAFTTALCIYTQTGEAVGISIGVFLAIIATAVVIILAIIGYSKYGDPG